MNKKSIIVIVLLLGLFLGLAPTVMAATGPAHTNQNALLVSKAVEGDLATVEAGDRTTVGGPLSLQPDYDTYAVAGSVVFYGHTLTNNGQTSDCFAVTVAASEGWTVLLWSDLNQNGVHETVSPNEPPLPNPVCLGPGQTQYLVAEVQVPGTAVAGTVNITTLTAYSADQPDKFDTATDITRIFVNDPPVIDGRYDDIYRISPDATEVCYTANGILFGKLATFYQSSGDAVYMVLAIDKDFVDNTYGANAIGWPSGHTFGNLTGSDHAQFLGFNADGVQVLNFKLDYLSSASGTPSGYRSLGLGGDGGISQGSAAHILDWGTSLEYNLNELGYCSGGNCSGLGTDLLVDSPATDAFYTPNPTYPDWIFDVIYEVKIDKAAFGATGFGSMEIPYIHASPSKIGTNTILAEPGVCPGEIGDTVWHDVDRNGLQDPGEPGLAGVTVRLYRDDGDGVLTAADTLVATQITNTSGRYLFQNLAPDNYFVSVNEATVPTGFVITTFNNPTSVIHLGEGESYLQADFGYTEPYPELAITKTLLTQGDIFVGQTVQFNIRITNTGTTTITVLPLEDYYDPTRLTYVAANPPSDDTINDGALRWSDLTASFGSDLAPGQSFNVVLTFQAIGSTTVVLAQQADAAVPAPQVAAAAASAPTAEPTVDGLLDADYNFVGQLTSPPYDAPGRLYNYEGTNACYWAFVVDRAFNDNVYADEDLDNSYMALDGWTRSHTFSNLLNSDNAVFTLTYPGGSRTITLDYLNGGPGAWSSGFTGSDGSSSTPNPPGTVAKTSLHWNMEYSNWTGGPWNDPRKHSPPYDYNQVSGQYWEWVMIYEFAVPKSATNGVCGTVTLASAHNSPSKHNADQGTIGDRVWEDLDRDGVQDGGEVGLPHVTVKLYQDSTLVRITSTEPGTTGSYLFNNLPAGNYTVQVDETTVPVNYGLTSGNMPLSVSLSSGQDYTDADFGYYLLGEGVIGDRVFYDVDGSGLPDDGSEPGLNGVVVRLYQGACPAGGSPLRSFTTAGNGQYLFQNLMAGTYCVDVDESTLPAGLSLTTANEPQTVTLPTNTSSYLTADFGYRREQPGFTCDLAGVSDARDAQNRVPPPVYDDACVRIQAAGSIGDYVWNDSNGNGLQDEPPSAALAGVGLRLYADDGDAVFEPGGDDTLVATTATAADGTYRFDNLPPGSYWVDVDESTLTGFTLIPGSQSGPEPHRVVLGPNQAYDEADFGYAGRGSISGVVFFDWDQNGVQGLGEAGIPGVEVCLYVDTDDDGLIDPGSLPVECVSTQPDGSYVFSGYLPGNYLVVQTPISGFENTTPLVRDVTLIVIGSSGTAPNNDFGNVAFGSIGDFIYLDSNGNGAQDPGETTGVAGVLVTVTNLDTGQVFTTTSAGGFYLVEGLIPGTYRVEVPATVPGLVRTSPSPLIVTLGLNEDYLQADFGYIAPTAVQLSTFTAVQEGGAVVVRWATVAEQDQEGFRVWRGTAVEGPYVPVSGLIAAANSPTGARYEWVDRSVVAGVSYWYKLESVPDGQWFGPVGVGQEEGLRRLFLPLVRQRR